jgi:hypothetical protein
MITVKELIEELQEYPEDTPVVLGYTPVTEVYLQEDFYFADSKNPNQAFGPAVVIE